MNHCLSLFAGILFLLSLTECSAPVRAADPTEAALTTLTGAFEANYGIKVAVYEVDGLHKNRAFFAVGDTWVRLNSRSDAATVFVTLSGERDLPTLFQVANFVVTTLDTEVPAGDLAGVLSKLETMKSSEYEPLEFRKFRLSMSADQASYKFSLAFLTK